MKDVQFEQTRKALQSKQRDLKRKGKGNKPNASAALSEEDIQALYDKELLGSSTAEALLNTVWFNNTIHFGLRGCKVWSTTGLGVGSYFVYPFYGRFTFIY